MISNFFKTNCLTIVSLVFIILVLLLMLLNGNTKKISSKVFILLLIFTIISSILYIIWGGFAVSESIMSIIMTKISVFFFEIWVFIFMYYMYVYVSGDEKIINQFNSNKVKYFIFFAFLVIINFLFCFFLDAKDVIYSDGLYMMGGSIIVYCNALGFLSIVYAVIMFLFNLKKFDRTARILTLPCVLVIGGSLILTSLNVLVLNDFVFRFAVLVMFLYLSLESRDAVLLEEYNISTKKSEESNKLKSEFIMNMSHQLRTPMNIILGFSDLVLLNDNYDFNSVKDDANNIKVASYNLFHLICAILDISKLEGGKESICSDNYNLENIIYDISSNINSKLKENLVFTINVDEICPNDLVGDANKLCKILNTVILNAVNHTEYGEVSLNVSCIQVDSLNYEFTFLIKNSGHTMLVDDFNRSFEDLIKLSNDNKGEISADVLNLIVAKGLLELIGGSVEFINETGKGTQYIIKLKQKLYGQNRIGNVREKIQTKHKLSYNILSLIGKKVLIIDENKVNTTILKRLLSQYNLDIEISLNPKDGINLVNNNKYDFIIVSHNMKDMSGVDVVNKINSTVNVAPPIIGLFTQANEVNSVYNYVLNCPVEFRELNKIINKIFNGGDL